MFLNEFLFFFTVDALASFEAIFQKKEKTLLLIYWLYELFFLENVIVHFILFFSFLEKSTKKNAMEM